MSEEKEGGSIKGAVIGGITLLITTVTGVVATKFESLFGSKEETPTEVQAQPATQQPQIVINNAQTQAQQASGGKTVIIKEKSAEPVKEKPKPKTAKEELEEAPKW